MYVELVAADEMDSPKTGTIILLVFVIVKGYNRKGRNNQYDSA